MYTDEDLKNKLRECDQFMGEAHIENVKEFRRLLITIIEIFKRREEYKTLLSSNLQNIEQVLVNITEKNKISIMMFLNMLVEDFCHLPEKDTNRAIQWLTLYLWNSLKH